jgi:hypothetical protein
MSFWKSKSEETVSGQEDRLRKIAAESDADETGKIQSWLDLARKFFGEDDDATPSAA